MTLPWQILRWLTLTWRPVDTENLPKIEPEEYPERLAPTHLDVGVALLDSQNAQAAAIDNKLAVAGGAALAAVALTLSALSNLESEGSVLSNQELRLIVSGAALLLFAFLNSVRGLWPRTYRELPSLASIRALARERHTNDEGLRWSDEDVRWSIAVSVEQAVTVNARVMQARLATIKLTYTSILVGGGLLALAFGPRFVP